MGRPPAWPISIRLASWAWPRGPLAAAVLCNALFWLVYAGIDSRRHGLFVGLGVDFSRFWAAARLIGADPPTAYQLPSIAEAMRPIAHYTVLGAAGVRLGPSPYPPVFLDFFRLFTLVPLPVGFLLWTAFNLVLVGIVAIDLARSFSPEARRMAVPAMLVTYPLMLQFFVGQVVALLVFSLWLALKAFRQGAELQGGFWLGLLLFKPQYAPWLLLVLLCKRRWRAVAGAALAGMTLVLSSLVMAGPAALVAYVRMLVVYPRFNGADGIDPALMIGWRSLVGTALPQLGRTGDLAVTAGLSLATLAALVVIWHGPWQPASARFSWQVLATLIVTLLVAYHSQPTGLALLLVPGAYVVADRRTPKPVRQLLLSGLWLPLLLGVISALTLGNLRLVPTALTLLLVALIFGMLERLRLPAFDARRARFQLWGAR